MRKNDVLVTRKGKDWVDVFLQYNIDVPGRTIFLNGEIGYTTLDIVVSGLHLIGHDKEVLVIVNSPGGDLNSGLGIFDALRNHAGHVTGRVVGEACSAACILLQACDTREATKHSTIMHHVGEAHFGNHARNVQLFTDYYKKQLIMVDELMVTRINETLRKRGEEPISKSSWSKRNQWDTWLTAEEARAMGLLDNIVGE